MWKSLLLEADCLLGFLIENYFFQSCHSGKKIALLRNPIFYPKTVKNPSCSWILCSTLGLCLWGPGASCSIPCSFILPLTRIPSVAVKGQHQRQRQRFPQTVNFAYRLEIPTVANDLIALALAQGRGGFGTSCGCVRAWLLCSRSCAYGSCIWW